MSDFQCVPITTATAERFRVTLHDDHGNAVRRMIATGAGFPCRYCLQCAQAGETMLLGSYDLPRPQGIYWTPSPIFVHEGACERFSASGTIAPIIRYTLISVRAYDAEGMCLYDLGQVCEGEEADAPIRRALADDRAAFVNIHTARPGCLLCQVERTQPAFA